MRLVVKVLGIVSTIALTSASDTKDRFEEASALCQMLRWEEAKVILNKEIERLGKMDIQSEDAIDYLDKFVMLGVVAEESSGSKKRPRIFGKVLSGRWGDTRICCFEDGTLLSKSIGYVRSVE